SEFSFWVIREAQRLNSATESTSMALNLESPSTGDGLSPMFFWKMSSRDGAGSVEQTVTRVSGSLLSEQNARAAVVGVFPTPPLPTVNDKGTSATGHSCFCSLSLFLRAGGGFLSSFPARC